MIKQMVGFFVAGLALLLLSACAPIQYRAYEGPVARPDELALLSIDRSTWIHEIDGKPTGITSYNPGEMGVDVQLLPGRHVLSVSYSTLYMSTTSSVTTYSKGRVSLSFDFQKGRKYEIHYMLNGVFRPEIIDVTQTTPRKDSFANWGRL